MNITYNDKNYDIMTKVEGQSDEDYIKYIMWEVEKQNPMPTVKKLEGETQEEYNARHKEEYDKYQKELYKSAISIINANPELENVEYETIVLEDKDYYRVKTLVNDLRLLNPCADIRYSKGGLYTKKGIYTSVPANELCLPNRYDLVDDKIVNMTSVHAPSFDIDDIENAKEEDLVQEKEKGTFGKVLSTVGTIVLFPFNLVFHPIKTVKRIVKGVSNLISGNKENKSKTEKARFGWFKNLKNKVTNLFHKKDKKSKNDTKEKNISESELEEQLKGTILVDELEEQLGEEISTDELEEQLEDTPVQPVVAQNDDKKELEALKKELEDIKAMLTSPMVRSAIKLSNEAKKVANDEAKLINNPEVKEVVEKFVQDMTIQNNEVVNAELIDKYFPIYEDKSRKEYQDSYDFYVRFWNDPAVSNMLDIHEREIDKSKKKVKVRK